MSRTALRFSGKHVLIGGGASGIGFEVANVQPINSLIRSGCGCWHAGAE